MEKSYFQSIAEVLPALLRQRHAVVIPNLGAFVGVYESASVDHLSGVAHPPNLKVSFDPDLHADDGVLTAHLVETYGWTSREAEQRLADFVRQVLDVLQERQIVDFPGLGKLYLDFDKTYRFVQESENLNKDAFGLPEVVTPLVKAVDEKKKQVPVTAAGITEVSASSSGVSSHSDTEKSMPKEESSGVRRAWWQYSLPWVLLMFLIILLVSGYFLSKRFSSNGDGKMAKREFEETHSEKDQLLESDGQTSGEEYLFSDDPEDVDDLLNEDTLAEEIEEDSESPTLPPDIQEAVIIVGSFTQPRNAERLIQRLYEDGYEAYSDRKGGRTRVGIRFAYSSETELMNYLEDMKNKYNVDAWILK